MSVFGSSELCFSPRSFEFVHDSSQQGNKRTRPLPWITGPKFRVWGLGMCAQVKALTCRPRHNRKGIKSSKAFTAMPSVVSWFPPKPPRK